MLLLFSAGPVDIRLADVSPRIAAILQCFLPAQGTGDALKRVLFEVNGEVTSPAGRLPYTWPLSLEQVCKNFNVIFCEGVAQCGCHFVII